MRTTVAGGRASAANPYEAHARLEKATKIHAALLKARDAGLKITMAQVTEASAETRELLARAAGVNVPSPETMQVVAELMERYDCTCDPFNGLPGNDYVPTFCVVHPRAHLKAVG